MNDISETGSDFVRDLGEAVRKNPLSAALIGMGVLWLFTGNRPVERAGEFVRGSGFDRIPDAAGNAFQATHSTLRSRVDSIGERAIAAKDALQDQGADVLENAARFGLRLLVNSAMTLKNSTGDLIIASLWGNSKANCRSACAISISFA